MLDSLILDILSGSPNAGRPSPWANVTGKESGNEVFGKIISSASQPEKPESVTAKKMSNADEAEDYARQRRLLALNEKIGSARGERELGTIGRENEFNQEMSNIYGAQGNDDEKDSMALNAYKRIMGSEAMRELTKRSVSHGASGALERDMAYLRQIFPGKSDEELYTALKVPSMQFSPSESKISGAQKLSEAQALGGLTPQVRSGKSAQAAENEAAKNAVELGFIPKKVETQATAEGKSKRTQAVNEAKTSSKWTNKSLDILEEAYNAVPGLYKNIAMGAVAESKVGGAMLSKNVQEKVERFKTIKARMAQEVARQLEKGVLSDRDRIFYQNLLGTLQATPAQFGAKIKALRDLSKEYQQSMEESKADIESNSFQNIQSQNPSEGGIWGNDKESRYQELIRKKREGTLK